MLSCMQAIRVLLFNRSSVLESLTGGGEAERKHTKPSRSWPCASKSYGMEPPRLAIARWVDPGIPPTCPFPASWLNDHPRVTALTSPADVYAAQLSKSAPAAVLTGNRLAAPQGIKPESTWMATPEHPA